ncbi:MULTISPECIES: non-canonical purine NTP diphosphatase [Flavobacterium]|uniref:dITP/XTP pyrophosphatase n=2 Tax=Flavobacterium TaxID=237 RepID=A0AA94F3V9_9FLAO|nr:MULTISPECIES: non-canonical purine NTP diphosphatase [Flavobacterium]OXA81033.1 non-canonical purine NTP diphosphatase [Flavobacterium columnare NBRC 100251 = ATCC 23463]AMA49297.1 non-canonical purine NTP pyrophosphatase [Flavobacterium covae]AND62998.1 non-canonical purine NTP pyrophosphatase [Flavobacterium covae]MCH4828552.1 non-canonical purine NTP diphosphatase [Flavobacterium columnare]MCH4831805.1 non-canonical purine NTP diphosphatase [Flavobacterium columnare]
MKIVFASNNQNKIKEIKRLIPDEIEILSLKDINCLVDIPETATTIEGNARLKADYITQHYGYACFADDSGLEVEALNGEPGVFSARYAGEEKDDQKNMDKLLSVLSGELNRKANFKTVIALNLKNQQYLFTGTIDGKITFEQRGLNGFGYDPIFIPDGYENTFAEITLEEKSKISHRAKAVKQLVEFINKI